MTDNLPPLPEFEKWLRFVCFQAPPAHAYDLARCAWIESDKQASADVEAMAEEIQRLQNALAFWMPDVPPENHPLYKRVADDVYLLVGCDGPSPEPSAFELGHVSLAEPQQQNLWAIHVPGPDDYYPAPSEEAAHHMAAKHNAAMTEYYKANPDTSGHRPPIESALATATAWTGNAADHAEEIAVFDYAAWGLTAPQPQPVPQSRMAKTVEEAARDVAKCLNERDGHGLDLRHVAMLVTHAQQPVQQEPCPECDGTGTVAGSQAHFPCPLCTSPQAPQPLTREQRNWIIATCPTTAKVIDAVEQAHGITEGTT